MVVLSAIFDVLSSIVSAFFQVLGALGRGLWDILGAVASAQGAQHLEEGAYDAA